MASQIEKFKLEETIRRLYFKYRGDVLKVAKEAGLEDRIDFVRKVSVKIKRGFKHNTANFEIACFVTDALLAGREQRLILLEDRVQKLLSKFEFISTCHSCKVTKHEYEKKIWYKCNSCGENCDITLEDCVNDQAVVRYIDRMRKEDELVYKFMVTMGFISKIDQSEGSPETLPVDVIESETKSLSAEEATLMNQLQKMDGIELTELRKTIQDRISKAAQARDNFHAK
jgi:hypothetical protein